MRVLCAPDSFKECLSARQVAAAMAAGARRAGASVDECPVADGGEGTLQVLVEAAGGVFCTRAVTGPCGEPLDARFGLIRDDVGVVELAEASGLAHVPAPRRDPEATTTRGTGELIVAAASAGARRLIVTLGGSSTVDGGVGLAQAAGVVFLDRDGKPIDEPLAGADLDRIHGFRPPDPPLPPITAACDVTNPLRGPDGATVVYGPQKGATPEQVARLDAALAALAERLGVDADTPGFGAAGGAGFGLATFLGARLCRGAELVLETLRFEERCARADLVFTGEGRMDGQTRMGKAVSAVVAAAGRLGTPVVAVAGDATPDVGSWSGLSSCVSLTGRYGAAAAWEETRGVLARAVEDEVRLRQDDS